MKRITEKGKRNIEIRQTALNLVCDRNQKDFIGEIKAVHQFVRDHIRYVKDIKGVETLQSPMKTIEISQGDCDDKTMLVCALLESIGHQCRIVAVGFGAGFSHVYPEVRINRKWIPVETTEPWPLGKKAKGIKQRLVKYID